MAPQPPEQPSTDADAVLDAEAAASAVEVDRTLWAETRISPVEIALPGGVGFTLRAYRMSDELQGTEVAESDEDDLFDPRAQADWYSRAKPEPKPWFRGVSHLSVASGSSSKKRLLML